MGSINQRKKSMSKFNKLLNTEEVEFKNLIEESLTTVLKGPAETRGRPKIIRTDQEKIDFYNRNEEKTKIQKAKSALKNQNMTFRNETCDQIKEVTKTISETLGVKLSYSQAVSMIINHYNKGKGL